MTVEIRVPALGESVTEATVAKWFKSVGEPVKRDEPLVELETDKVTLEVNAASSGRLTEIAADAGANVEVGALLGQLEAGEVPADSPPAPEKSDQAQPAKAAPAKSEPAKAEPAKPAGEAAQRTTPQQPLSPAVRRLIEETGIDAGRIAGTGKDGRITKGDVLAYQAGGTETQQSAAPAEAGAPQQTGGRAEERVRMTRLRQRIAERLKHAQNSAAMLTTFNEVDMSAVMAVRSRYKDDFEKKHGAKLGFMSFFVKAAVSALKEIPEVNAEIDGTDIVYKNYCDIGVAVGTEQGLVVPVLRDADRLSFAEIESGIAALGLKARDGKLTIDELTGGTFTISNGGVYGSMLSTPILNPPQSGILGMHNIQQRPIVVDGDVVARPMMYLALSYDHRIVDGREAVTFLVRIKQCIEDPERMLLDL